MLFPGLRCATVALLLLLGWPLANAQQSLAKGIPTQQRRELAKAETLYRRGQAKEAEGILRSILRRYPQDEGANETFGLLYAEHGAMERALPYLSRASKSPASTAADHANLGA